MCICEEDDLVAEAGGFGHSGRFLLGSGYCLSSREAPCVERWLLSFLSICHHDPQTQKTNQSDHTDHSLV